MSGSRSREADDRRESSGNEREQVAGSSLRIQNTKHMELSQQLFNIDNNIRTVIIFKSADLDLRAS